MVQQAGWDKANRMWIDKPLWDTDRDNDGGADVMLQMSGWDGLMVIAGLATGGAVNPAVAAGIMGGLSMAHSTANLAAGHLNVEQWGVEMLRSGVSTLGNIATAGLGNSLGDIILRQAVNSGSSLISSGLSAGPDGIQWNISRGGWSQWGAGALTGMLGGALTTGPLNIGGGITGRLAGGSAFGNALVNGLGQGLNSFVSTGISQLGQMALDPAKAFDWASAGRNFAVGGMTGFASGMMSSALGGKYEAGKFNGKKWQDGGYRYNDLAGKSLFYNDKLGNFSSTFGGLIGEVTDRSLGGSFDLNLGDYRGFHWGPDGVSVDQNAQGLSVGNFLHAIGDMKYLGINAMIQRGNKASAPVQRIPNSRGKDFPVELKSSAILNREWDLDGQGDTLQETEPVQGSFGMVGMEVLGKIKPHGTSLEKQAEELAGKQIRQQINNMDFDMVDGKVMIGGVAAPEKLEEYKRQILKQLETESMTNQHKQMLASLTDAVGDGEVREKINNLISNYRLQDGQTNTTVIQKIIGEMQNVTNMAMEYSGINRNYQKAIGSRLDSSLNTALQSGDWYSAFGDQSDRYKVEMMKAANRAILLYGVNDQTWKKAGTDRDEFNIMFGRQLQHAASVRDGNVVSFDMNSDYGKARMEEYRYFADLRGGKGSFDKAIKEGYAITGEEGLGKYYKTTGDKDVYDDRLTIFKDGKVVEFYRSNLDPSKNPEYQYQNTGRPYSAVAPGVYTLDTYFRESKRGQLPNREFSIRVEYGRTVPAQNGPTSSQARILIHIGGPTFNWSKGCSTIYGGETTGQVLKGSRQIDGGDFEKLMQMFGEEKTRSDGTRYFVYDNAYGKKGYYYLLSQ